MPSKDKPNPIIYLLEVEFSPAGFTRERVVKFPAIETEGDYYRLPEQYGRVLTSACNLYAFVDNEFVSDRRLPQRGDGFMRPSRIEKNNDFARIALSCNLAYRGVWFTVKTSQLRVFSKTLLEKAAGQ